MDNKADLTLYFHHGSYHSRRVLLSLFEKNIPFHRMFVNILAGEQNEDWYMRINPLGQVPVIQHGDRIICNSDDIIKYIDSNFKTGNVLVPPEDTKPGQDVQEFCQLLNTISIDVITYGLIRNPELSYTGLKVPNIVLRGARKKLEVDVLKIGHKAEQKTDLSDAYSDKHRRWLVFLDKISNKKTVAEHLDGIEAIFLKVEKTLEKSRADAVVQSSDVWLFGSRFTMADIYLTILMDRLDGLGMGNRYFSVNQNPNAFRYFEQVRCRQSFRKLTNQIYDMLWNIIVSKLRKASPVLGFLAIVGLAIGAVIAWKK